MGTGKYFDFRIEPPEVLTVDHWTVNCTENCGCKFQAFRQFISIGSIFQTLDYRFIFDFLNTSVLLSDTDLNYFMIIYISCSIFSAIERTIKVSGEQENIQFRQSDIDINIPTKFIFDISFVNTTSTQKEFSSWSGMHQIVVISLNVYDSLTLVY